MVHVIPNQIYHIMQSISDMMGHSFYSIIVWTTLLLIVGSTIVSVHTSEAEKRIRESNSRTMSMNCHKDGICDMTTCTNDKCQEFTCLDNAPCTPSKQNPSITANSSSSDSQDNNVVPSQQEFKAEDEEDEEDDDRFFDGFD